MGPLIEIAELTPEGADAVRRLILDGLAERWDVLDPGRNADLDDLGTVGRTIVATCAGELVGTATLVERGDEAEVRRMSVRRDRRGAGIGRRLLAELVDTAGRRGIRRIVLETTSSWTDAVAFYGSCGFVATHVDGDDTWFELLLAP